MRNKDSVNWVDFFTRFLEKLLDTESTVFYLVKKKKRLNTKMISKVITLDKELHSIYWNMCLKTYGNEKLCNNINLVVKNVMYTLYRRRREPVSSFMEILFIKGYVTREDIEYILRKY